MLIINFIKFCVIKKHNDLAQQPNVDIAGGFGSLDGLN